MNRIRCQLCLPWEPRIKTGKNVSQVCVSLGSESIMQDSVKKYSKSLQHHEAYKLQQKSELDANVYMERVALNSPLQKSFLWLKEADKDGLHMTLRTVYYNIKNENLYTDYPDLNRHQIKWSTTLVTN